MLVEQTFGWPCVGMRPGCGFDRGLRGAPWLVRAIADAGFGYTKPEEECAMNRIFIDRAVDPGLPYVSLIWHPCSLARFDPAMTMLAVKCLQ